jgi:hypothetical protein
MGKIADDSDSPNEGGNGRHNCYRFFMFEHLYGTVQVHYLVPSYCREEMAIRASERFISNGSNAVNNLSRRILQSVLAFS